MKGRLEEKLSAGILAKSWNQWVDKNGVDGARIAGVKVGRIDCYTESYGYTVHPEEKGGANGSGTGTSYWAACVPTPCMRWILWKDTMPGYHHMIVILIEKG